MEEEDNQTGNTSRRFLVDRRAFDQGVFNEAYQVYSVKEPHAKEKIKRAFKCKCSFKSAIKIIRTLFPIIDWTRKYDVRKYLFTDIIVGLTVMVFQVPQGMAYGQLADVSPINGLYTSFFPVLIYALMGTSKQLSVGTYAVMSLMVGGIVAKYPVKDFCHSENCTTWNDPINNTPISALDVVIMLCFISGLYQLIFGLLRFGSLSVFLSPQLVSGFTTAAAIHILTSQFRYVLDLEIVRYNGAFNLIYTYIALFKNISHTNLVTLAMSLSTIGFMVFFKELVEPRVKKKIKIPLPIEIVVLTIGIITSNTLHLNQKYNMTVVDSVPVGLPNPVPPNFHIFTKLAYDALPLAIVSFASSISIAKIYADKHNYVINCNQELIALGIANIFGTFFSCIPATASLSRSNVQSESGGKTQLVSLVNCIGLLFVLLFLAPILQGLPSCILAAITIVSLKGLLIQITDLKKYWKISILDGMIWLVTFLAVIILGIDIGLGVGVGFSLSTLILRTQRPRSYLLGEVGNTNVYVPVKKYLVAKEIPSVKIFYFGGPLHFANAEYFMNMIENRVSVNIRKLRAEKEKSECKIQRNISIASIISSSIEMDETSGIPSYIIIDCSGFNYIDTPGVIALKKVIEEFREVGITVYIAACPANVNAMLKKMDFFADVSHNSVYPTVHDAVLHCNHEIHVSV
ncbi:prestin-like [Centruroides vittatus]|uniref:prestin-like n=1 Tax=Centruroides vittatus TaxID=120091 RepID=UPI00350E9546